MAVARVLQENKANVNAEGRYKYHALWAAAEGGHEAVVRLLHEWEPIANTDEDEPERTLSAAHCGANRAVIELIASCPRL